MSRDIKYIGMDVHKEATVIAVLNGSGKLVMESIVETKASSILQFIHGLRGELHVTWEEGTWAAWLYDLLQPQVTRVLVCDPRRNALLGRQQKRQDRRAQAGRLVTHGNGATGLSRGTRSADAARTGAQLSDHQPRPEPSDESDQSSVSRLEYPLCGDPVYAPRYREEWLQKIEHDRARVAKELEALCIVAPLLQDEENWVRENARPTLTVTGQSLLEAGVDSPPASSARRGRWRDRPLSA